MTLAATGILWEAVVRRDNDEKYVSEKGGNLQSGVEAALFEATRARKRGLSYSMVFLLEVKHDLVTHLSRL